MSQTYRSRFVADLPKVDIGTNSLCGLTVFTYTEGLVNCRSRS
jgi:hypothetical protein